MLNNEDVENGYEQILFDWILVTMTVCNILFGLTGLILTLPFFREKVINLLSNKENTRLIMKQWIEKQYTLTKWLSETEVEKALQLAENSLEESAKVAIKKHRGKKELAKVYPSLTKRLNLASISNTKRYWKQHRQKFIKKKKLQLLPIVLTSSKLSDEDDSSNLTKKGQTMFSIGSFKHVRRMKTIAGNHAEVGRIKRNRKNSSIHLKRKKQEVEEETLRKRKELQDRIERRKSKKKIKIKIKKKGGNVNNNKKGAVQQQQQQQTMSNKKTKRKKIKIKKKGGNGNNTKVTVQQKQVINKKETEEEVRESLKQFKHYRANAIYAKKTGDMVTAMSILKKCKHIKNTIKQKMKDIESSENSTS